MIKENISVNDALEVLNRALGADPKAMRALCIKRTPCNSELAADPTIQVQGYVNPQKYRVGLTGFVNGLFGTDDSGWGPICAHVEVVCNKCGYSADDFRHGDACPKICEGHGGDGKILKFAKTVIPKVATTPETLSF